LLRIQTRSDQCFFLSSSAVTKPQSLLRRAIINTGQSICQSVIYTTMYGVRIVMALFYLGFLPFQPVSAELYIPTVITLIKSRCLADKEFNKDAHFRKFRRQLLHSSLAKMLQSLKPSMTKPEVVRCLDGHFQRAIYGLGPYIADYPEQCLLACIVQNWCMKYIPYVSFLP
jgi:hypothetical protein